MHKYIPNTLQGEALSPIKWFVEILKTPFFLKKKRRVEALNSILKTPLVK
jgi:hypothetical protein